MTDNYIPLVAVSGLSFLNAFDYLNDRIWTPPQCKYSV